MSGEVGLLVLTAPLFWWPSAADLHRYPLIPMRSLLSAATVQPPVNIKKKSANDDSTTISSSTREAPLRLSRLGRSIFMSGRLSAGFVHVYCPFRGGEVIFRVDATRSGDALGAYRSLRAMVSADAVRISPRPLFPAPSFPAAPLNAGAGPVARALERVARALLCDDAAAGCSVLFTAESAADASRALSAALRGVPALLSENQSEIEGRSESEIESGRESRSRSAARPVERRALCLARVLELDAREAAAAVRCACAPPPPGPASGARVVLALESVALLAGASASASAFSSASASAALVAHALLCALDAAGGRVVVLAAASAAAAAQLPDALRARIAAVHAHIPPRSASAERNAGAERSAGAEGDVFSGFVGVADAVRALESLAVWPLRQLPLLRRAGVRCPRGALLCGPSGCGKTALLRALAQRLRGLNICVRFVDGLTLVEKEVGRTEKNIAALFAAARAEAPCALFLDNIDALAPPRRAAAASGEVSSTEDRALSTLLTEMDGLGGDGARGRVVFVVASAPAPSALDAAARRPGRLDVHVTLRPPPPEAMRKHTAQRIAALTAETKESVNSDDVEQWLRMRKWGEKGETPADANALVREVLIQLISGATGIQEATLAVC